MVAALSPQNIVEAISSSSDSLSGCSQQFIKLTDNWGVKIFTEEEHGDNAEKIRNDTYETQKDAASIGCGPDVGDSIDLPDGDYAYITEIVPVFNPYVSGNQFWDNWVNGGEDDFGPINNRDFDNFLMSVHEYEINELIDDLKEIDFYFTDIHGGNMGWKNGRLICIDFC